MRSIVKLMQLTAKAVKEYNEAEPGTSSRVLKMGVMEGLFQALDAYETECVWAFEGKACHLSGFWHDYSFYDTEGVYVRQMPKASKD
jgi:hypothetical protein